MATCYSTCDGNVLVVGYVRAESGTSNIPTDIMLLCFHFFGDFSHLIGQSEPSRAIKEGMWYIDEIKHPCGTLTRSNGFAAQVKHLKRCKTGKHGHVKYIHDMVMPHRGKTLKGMFNEWTSFRQAIVSTGEYKFIELKCVDKNGGLVVLEVEDSVRMEVRVSFYQDRLRKLFALVYAEKRGEPRRIMMTVLSGPKSSEDKVELVQCVVDVRAANTF